MLSPELPLKTVEGLREIISGIGFGSCIRVRLSVLSSTTAAMFVKLLTAIPLGSLFKG